MPLKPPGVEKLSLLLLLTAVAPFFILALYCHPSGDDFWLTNMVIKSGIWSAQWEIRQNWSGRYTSMFLAALNPLTFHSLAGYQAVPILTLLLFLAGAQYLVRAIFPGAARQTQWLLAFLLLALYLGFMPVVSQTIYWLSGTISYQLAHIALFFLVGLVLQRARPAEQSRLFLLPALFLIFFIAGSNETIMACLFYLVAGTLFFEYLLHKKIRPASWALLVFTGACCALVLSAPGNAQRVAEYPQHGKVFSALFTAVLVAANNSLNWLTAAPVITLTLLLMPWARKHTAWPLGWLRIHPALTWLYWYGALVTCFFVSYYSKGDHAPPRVQDTIYFIFLLGWFLNVLHTLHYLEAKSFLFPPLPAYARWGLCLLISLWLFHSRQSHIRTAWGDLVSGRAARYDQEMQARYRMLESSDCQVCKIPTVKNIPTTIFFEEIPADTTWKNRYFSEYFGKQLMIMADSPQSTDHNR